MSDKLTNAILAVILGTMMSVAAVGCMISGFDLKIDQIPMIVMVAGLFALIGAIGFSVRYGTVVVLGIMGMASIFFWSGGEAQTQTQALITRLSYVYDQAYHWGIIRFPTAWYGVKADLPMVILATLIALIVTWVICKRRPVVFALAAALVPLVPCLVVTDTIPNGTCIFFLLIGMLTVLLTAYARRRDPAHSPRVTLIASVAVVTAVSVLFAAVPQRGYRNPFASLQDQILESLGYEGSGSGGNGGDVDGVDLKGLGSRFFLQYPVLTVTSETAGVLYLREEDFNVYNGYAWESDGERRDRVIGYIASPLLDDLFVPYFETDELINVYGVYDDSGDTWETDDEQQDLVTVPVEDAYTNVSIETRWYRGRMLMPYYVSHMLSDGGVPNVDKLLEYDWDVYTPPTNWREEIPDMDYGADVVSATIDPKYYHSLPAETQGWAQEFLKTVLTQDEQSATAKADAIAAYVQGMARYEDDCKRMPSSAKDFARWFVEDGESGYCVHFATATAVLLRAAGVNTRYVTGYMVKVNANEKTTVTADMEHAWVEYYEPALGRWVMLESTPAEQESVEQTETTTLTTTTTAPLDNTTQPTQPQDADEQGSRIPWHDILAVVGKAALCLAGAAATVSLVIGQRRWRMARRERRFAQSTANERALLLWRETVRMGRYAGSPPPETLYALAQKAKFSQHTLTDEELQLFVQERRACIARLRKHDALTRFVHRYVLGLY